MNKIDKKTVVIGEASESDSDDNVSISNMLWIYKEQIIFIEIYYRKIAIKEKLFLVKHLNQMTVWIEMSCHLKMMIDFIFEIFFLFTEIYSFTDKETVIDETISENIYSPPINQNSYPESLLAKKLCKFWRVYVYVYRSVF